MEETIPRMSKDDFCKRFEMDRQKTIKDKQLKEKSDFRDYIGYRVALKEKYRRRSTRKS